MGRIWLSWLPLRDIWNCRCVSRTWKSEAQYAFCAVIKQERFVIDLEEEDTIDLKCVIANPVSLHFVFRPLTKEDGKKFSTEKASGAVTVSLLSRQIAAMVLDLEGNARNNNNIDIPSKFITTSTPGCEITYKHESEYDPDAEESEEESSEDDTEDDTEEDEEDCSECDEGEHNRKRCEERKREEAEERREERRQERKEERQTEREENREYWHDFWFRELRVTATYLLQNLRLKGSRFVGRQQELALLFPASTEIREKEAAHTHNKKFSEATAPSSASVPVPLFKRLRTRY
jgi:hypothetical protein